MRGSGRFEAADRARAQERAQVSIPFIAGQWSLCRPRRRRRPRWRRVSIPFIAGQWSLCRGGGTGEAGPGPFQSPSLRGSGRFNIAQRVDERTLVGFNPLHCGAVVALCAARRRTPTRRRVSIPFIAGQWSLSEAEERARQEAKARFNPLHCGAVVAFVAHIPPPARSGECFNPLHCGAVVALSRSAGGGCCCRRVSIPFIAGQWSL